MDVSDRFFALCHGNASDGNSTSDLWLVEDRVTGQVTAAFLLLILVVGLPWNLLVVFTIVKKKLYHQPTIVLLLNLVVNDLIVHFVGLPPRIVVGFAGEFIFGSTDSARCLVCHVGLVSVLFSLMSLYIIAIMAFDRFLFIYKPLHYEKIVTSFRMMVLLIAVWVSIFWALVIPVILGEKIIFNSAFLSCVQDFKEDYLAILLSLSVIPVLVLVVFNVWVVVIVQRNIRAIYSVRKSLRCSSELDTHSNALRKKLSKKKHQKQIHLIQVFGFLLTSNLISWLPISVVVVYLLVTRADPGEGPTQLVAAFYVFLYTQVTVHPIIETVLIQDVREPLKRLVCLCVGKGRHHDGAYPDDSGRSWSCDSSRLGCCGEFLSVVHAAMLEHSRHSHSEQGDSKNPEAETNSELQSAS